MDFEVVFTPIGSNVTTADLYVTDEMGSVAAQMFRVLPSMGGDPTEVAKTSTPYTWIDRTDAKYVADVLTTLPNAGNVSAVLKPDLPGTYMVLVTVLDSCNVTTQVSSSLFSYARCA